MAFLWIPVMQLHSQCCSTGSPVGASTYAGILNKNTFRVTSFFRQSYSEVYFKGTKTSDDSLDMANHASYSYLGLSMEYGITPRLTAQFDGGYFFNKVVDFRNTLLTDHNGRGLSNGSALIKYGLFVDSKRLFELTAGIGLKFPFSLEPAKAPNGTLLQLDARPSTNAFGLVSTLVASREYMDIGLRMLLLNRYEFNFANSNEYQSGQLNQTSFFLSKRIVPGFMGIIQLRNEIHGKDVQKGEKEVNTGYHLLVIAPQLSLTVARKWSFSVLYDLPVYKNYKGKQLTPHYAWAISLTRDFNNCGFHRSKKQNT